MQYIQLLHDKHLGLGSLGKMGAFDCAAFPKDADYVFSFRKFNLKKIKKENIRFVKNANACTRLFKKYSGNIFCFAIENDSPLAPAIFWDLAHGIQIGSKIYVGGEQKENLFLRREYYKSAFEFSQKDGIASFKKVAALEAERDEGMERWSFCIPSGPEDATLLNALVKRILSFECEKEIILCGRPAKNFRYFDKVRVVGEDIPAPPVQISKKKNRLINEAKYENLCILHDRVLLPSDFCERMKEYGDMYSFTTLQSLYFDDYSNLVLYRYSDINGITKNEMPLFIKARKGYKESSFDERLFSQIERMNFCYPMPMTMTIYPTGSLYILKRHVAKKIPLDSSLKWEEFEDVEYGIRMLASGVPCRVNPYAFSQSMNARHTILGTAQIFYRNSKGLQKHYKNLFSALRLLKRKPIFRISAKKMRENFSRFSAKYCKGLYFCEDDVRGNSRIRLVNKMIALAQFKRTPECIKEFLEDFSKCILAKKMSRVAQKYFENQFFCFSDGAKHDLQLSYEFLVSFCLRFGQDEFCESQKQYFLKKSFFAKIGSRISAAAICRLNYELFYFPKGRRACYKAIMNSTPWQELLN